MKLKCKVQSFQEMFQIVSSVANARSPKPILANVLIVASNEIVELRATDLEVAICCQLEGVEVIEPGSALLNAATLGEILRECDDEYINLETENFVTTASYTYAEYSLPGGDPDEFPIISAYDDAGEVELDAAALREMILCTSFAASRDTTSFALNGLFFVLKAKEIRLVGADRHRLAYIKRKASNPDKTEAAVIVPTKAMEQLEKMMSDNDKTVGVKITEKQILLKVKRGTVVAHLVEGKYPDYEAVIPKGCENKFEIDSQVLLHSVRKAAPVAPEDTKAIRIRLHSAGMTVSSAANDKGSAQIDVALDYKGQELELAINPEYLTDMLRVVGEKVVKVELRDAESPGLIKVGSDFNYVIMPMQVEE